MNVKIVSILILIILMHCFVYSVDSTSWEIDEITCICEIIDGDTFDTVSGDRIRLADVDAPENDESGYLQAKYFLYGLLYGKKIYLNIDDLYRYDTGGTRLVCVVYVRYNQTHLLNVNKALLENDFAEIKDYPNEFNPYTWNTFVYYSEIEEAILDAHVKVGLYYYVWYDNGSRHWNDKLCNAAVDEPILGYYSSQNETIIKQHLDWMMDLGMDFLIVSWWGNEEILGGSSYEDESCKLIFSIIKEYEYPIKAALMVEGFNETNDIYNFLSIFDYVTNTFVTPYADVYMTIDSKPLLCWYNADNMTGTLENPKPENINEIRNDSRFESRIVGRNDYVDWWFCVPCSVNNSTIPPLSKKDGMICIEPRYDDQFLGRAQNSTFDENLAEGLYDSQWCEAMRLAEEGKVSYVTIYSWNEYHERSQIEPHISIDGKYILSPLCKTKEYIQKIKGFPSIFREKALDFVESLLHNYADDKWLCREFPNSSNYWIYNDNYLAYKILEYLNRSESASKIEDTIESYGISPEGNGRMEVLFNQTIPFPPYNSTGVKYSPIIDSSSNFTVRNDVKHLQKSNWEEFADLLLFGVLDRYYSGNSSYKELWNKACKMFDGKGIADEVFNNNSKYETYKLALFVITSKIINNQTMATDCALNIIWKMQDESNGGVITHYLPDLTPDPNSTQNIETTCLAIYSTLPEVIPEFPSFLVLPLFMIATLLTVVVYRRKHSIELMTSEV